MHDPTEWQPTSRAAHFTESGLNLKKIINLIYGCQSQLCMRATAGFLCNSCSSPIPLKVLTW